MKFYLVCKQGKKTLWERCLSDIAFHIPQKTWWGSELRCFRDERLTVNMEAEIKDKRNLIQVMDLNYDEPIVTFEKKRKKVKKKVKKK